MDTSHKDRYKADLLTIKNSFYQDYWDGYGLSEEQIQWMINTIDAQAREIEDKDKEIKNLQEKAEVKFNMSLEAFDGYWYTVPVEYEDVFNRFNKGDAITDDEKELMATWARFGPDDYRVAKVK